MEEDQQWELFYNNQRHLIIPWAANVFLTVEVAWASCLPLYNSLLLSSLFISLMAGFHDHACPPPGHHNAHHILLCQQHAKSWHSGHVCARCIWHLPWGKELGHGGFSCSTCSKTETWEGSGSNSATLMCKCRQTGAVSYLCYLSDGKKHFSH